MVAFFGNTKPVKSEIQRKWNSAKFWDTIRIENGTPGWTIGFLDDREFAEALRFGKDKGVGVARRTATGWVVELSPTIPSLSPHKSPSGPNLSPDEELWTEGEGYRGRERKPGDVVQAPEKNLRNKSDWWFVVRELPPRYYREDGMSFGVGDDSGHIYQHIIRPATLEESLPIRLKVEKEKVKQELRVILRKTIDEIKKKGIVPKGPIELRGKEIENPLDKGNIAYGGGSWFVFESGVIWYVQNNGADGDDWSRNNIVTGGAGAIGWKVPKTNELESTIKQAIEILA